MEHPKSSKRRELGMFRVTRTTCRPRYNSKYRHLVSTTAHFRSGRILASCDTSWTEHVFRLHLNSSSTIRNTVVTVTIFCCDKQLRSLLTTRPFITSNSCTTCNTLVTRGLIGRWNLNVLTRFTFDD